MPITFLLVLLLAAGLLLFSFVFVWEILAFKLCRNISKPKCIHSMVLKTGLGRSDRFNWASVISPVRSTIGQNWKLDAILILPRLVFKTMIYSPFGFCLGYPSVLISFKY